MPPLPPLVAERLEDVRELCAKYSVRKLSIFGSAVKGTFDPERSDLDFVIELEGEESWRRKEALREELRAMFDRQIDLVELSTVRNVYLSESIRRATVAIYDAA